VYKDVTYILDEDGYAAADYQDLVRKRFIKSWEALIDGYKVKSVMLVFYFLPDSLCILGDFFGLQLSPLFWPCPGRATKALGEIHHEPEVLGGMI